MEFPVEYRVALNWALPQIAYSLSPIDYFLLACPHAPCGERLPEHGLDRSPTGQFRLSGVMDNESYVVDHAGEFPPGTPNPNLVIRDRAEKFVSVGLSKKPSNRSSRVEPRFAPIRSAPLRYGATAPTQDRLRYPVPLVL
jgi:hypothetical protein